MVDFTALIKKTNAYKIVTGEKKADMLSHAYLLTLWTNGCIIVLYNILKEITNYEMGLNVFI